MVGHHALYRGRTRRVLDVLAALTVALLTSQLVNHLSGQVRPFQTHHVHQLIAQANGVSLPSNHATAAFTVALAVAVFLHRGWGIVLLLTATAVGLARIWVGVHYAGDVPGRAVVAGMPASM